MSKSLELKALRAKRGKAAEKKVLMEDYRIMESMSWHYTILACGQPDSTYNGLYPGGVAKHRDAHEVNLKALEQKIRSICN